MVEKIKPTTSSFMYHKVKPLPILEKLQMVTGTVKFFNRVKSFGFIAGDDGKDYFVHATGLKPNVTIDEGDKVSFEVIEGEKGPKADKVEKQ